MNLKAYFAYLVVASLIASWVVLSIDSLKVTSTPVFQEEGWNTDTFPDPLETVDIPLEGGDYDRGLD